MADVTLPQLGETVTEGTITQWFKQVGDTVAADEALFEVSTDKVDTEVPSPVAGTLTEIRVQEGETVEVGTVIAVVGDGAASGGARRRPPRSAGRRGGRAGGRQAGAGAGGAEPRRRPSEPQAAGAAGAEPTPAEAEAAEPEPADAGARSPPKPAAKGILLSPVVRRLVNEHGLDPSTITGTGPGGRITRDDVLDHIDKTGATPAAPAGRPPPPRPAAGAARRAAAPAPAPAAGGHAAPPPTVTSGERDAADPAVQDPQAHRRAHGDEQGRQPPRLQRRRGRLRQRRRARVAIKDDWKRTEGFSLTYLPFISRATIDALAEFPHLNASVAENELVVHRYVDLGIAVDLDYEGLIVPVIRDADTKRLRAIAREINDLASRAKTRS